MEEPMVEITEGAAYYRGKLHMWVGGGAYTNTLTGRFVLSPDKRLKPCSWIRSRGPLACSEEQALVPLEIGDLVCHAGGRRPAVPENPDVYISCVRVEGVKEEKGVPIPYGRRVEVKPEEIPASVWEGLNTYHNRWGGYFCREEKIQ